jgi:hypothetical protein
VIVWTGCITCMRRILLGTAALMIVSSAFAQNSGEAESQTRFGTLEIDQGMLVFKGQRLEPPIRVNSGMDLGEPFHIGATDVVLVTNYGGTACPAEYYFVTVSKSGARGTAAFGTCSDDATVKRSGDSILVTMHGYRGPFEPEAERAKAARETHVFVFREGVVAERGHARR